VALRHDSIVSGSVQRIFNKENKMRKWIAFIVVGCLMAGCAATTGEHKKAGMGTGIGVAAGAGIGAIIGHQSGERDKGAALGAVVGGLLGAGIGHKMDQQAKELATVEAAEIKRTEDGAIVTSLKNNILFAVDSATLKPTALDSINQVSDVIRQYPEDHVIVVGHTDDTGSDAHNQQLSERRAQAVRLQMVSRGVPASSVEAVGQGESSPVTSNATEAGRAENRRVELHISVDPSKVRE
jgi:outer membrane protein OmpA-like peptidoglycan-associated protein